MIGKLLTRAFYEALKRYDAENPRRIIQRDEAVISFRAEGVDEIIAALDRVKEKADAAISAVRIAKSLEQKLARAQESGDALT